VLNATAEDGKFTFEAYNQQLGAVRWKDFNTAHTLPGEVV